MFEISVDDAKFWKGCIEAIVNLVEEGNLEVSSEGVSLKAMDPSQIAMVCFTAPKKAFSSFRAESSAKVGLNFDSLSKILARARGDEKLRMRVEENRLVLDFSGESGKRSFKVPLMDLPAGSQKEPKIEHEASVTMKAGPFKEILRDAALVSSHLTLEASEAGFSVDAHGDSADLHVESEKTAKAVEQIKVSKKARATFPLQYLEDIAKACPDDKSISIHLKSNAPVKIDYAVGDALLTYYLAPRIDVE